MHTGKSKANLKYNVLALFCTSMRAYGFRLTCTGCRGNGHRRVRGCAGAVETRSKGEQHIYPQKEENFMLGRVLRWHEDELNRL